MAFVLQLTDGTDTIDFMTEDFKVEDGGLQISPPEQIQTWTDPSDSGGVRLVDSRYGNRKIVITFQVSGTTRTEIRQKITRVNEMLKAAIKHSLGKSSDRVTLRYAWDGVSVTDNFEVFTGEFKLPNDMLSVEKLLATWGGTYFRMRGCELELTVSPDSYGVDPSTGSLVELPLTNRNGTDITGGIYIKPFTDPTSTTVGGYYIDNYVEIDGADILGDSPAKTRIEIQALGTNPRLDKILIGAHEKNTATLFFHPNTNLYIGGGGTTVYNTRAFGGSWFNSIDMLPAAAEEMGAPFRFDITSPENYKSEHYRVLWHTGTGLYHHTKFSYKPVMFSSQLGIEGSWTKNYAGTNNRGAVMDLGVWQVPPFSPKIPNPDDLAFSATAKQDYPDEYSYSFKVGYVQLLPVELGYRVLRFPSMIGNYINPTVIDDSWEDIAYIDNSGYDGSRAVVQPMFSPITLTPGKTTRIYFNFSGYYYTPENINSYKVKVYYSPSYLGAI